ncbi:hypothetical protein BC830DRAFT_1227167 [Chytriomyces sp. MP71]|nr:hypothetical protein BC830DRAFT_1227167 [Chytriomyces sp. MP71]
MTTQPDIDAQYCTNSIHKGTPLGSVEDIAGHKVYVAASIAASFDNTVVIATDVFGYTLPNTRLIVDNKTSTIGQKLTVFDRMMWRMPGTAMRNHDEKNNSVIKDVIAEVKKARGVKKEADVVDVVVVDHASGLSLSIPKYFTAYVKPILVILWETDNQSKPKVRDVIIETLNKRN